MNWNNEVMKQINIKNTFEQKAALVNRALDRIYHKANTRQ